MTRELPSRDRPGQKAAEERINSQKGEGGPFVEAVEATRMPMVVTDPHVPDNPIIYANEAFLELCGYGLEEVLGQNYVFLAGENTDPEMEGRIKAAMSARHVLVEDVQLYRKDGKPIWVGAFVSPVVVEGRIIQHFASFIEITRRVELERELTEAKETLERRVAERTRRLEQANAKLEEEVERRGRIEAVLRDSLTQREQDVRYRTFLAREIDHRTKNALQLASALLRLQASRTEHAAVRDALDQAMERLGRMAEIHALLYQGEAPGRVNFSNYLHRLVHEFRETLQPNPGQIDISLDADEVIWAPDLVIPLALIVSEAITNAMKHAFPDGRKGGIAISLRATGAKLMCLSIVDDGIGMPAKRRRGSLGTELIEVFASQIKGKALIETTGDHGTRVLVTFPSPNGG